MSLAVANTIANQIGPMALRMIGAKNLVGNHNSLSFKIGRNAKSVTHLRITLMPSDTYKVEALRIRTTNVSIVETTDDVYVDSLHTVIESLTGMYTSL